MRVIEIERPGDPRIAGYRDMKDRELRRELGLFVVEGRINVRCLIESSPYRPISVLASRVAFNALRSALERLEADTPVYLAERSVLRELVGFDLHRGCLALCRQPGPADFDALLERGGPPERDSLLVVLEGLANHDNVGGVFRNAMAFGVDAVLLCPRCCDPLYRKAIRTSMGASLCVPFGRTRSWPEAPFSALARAGYSLVALDPAGRAIGPGCDGGAAPGASRLPRRAALIFGTEGAGITPEALALTDLRLRIEMAAGMDSINVATASGIALHRFFAERRQGGGGAL